MKTCLSCNNCWSSFNRDATCTRKRTKIDIVGKQITRETICYFERSNWPRIFGVDTCGKEAKYWTPERPRVPPKGPGYIPAKPQ
jgi:hypothetical protein